MAGFLTNAGEELALNLAFRNTGSQPTTIKVGLATNDVSTNALVDGSVLADIVEEDDVGYAQQEVVFSAPTQVSGKGTIENDAQIEFGPWDSASDASITYAFLVDNNDVVLGIQQLTSAKDVGAGESLIITAGNCTFSLD